MTGSNTIPVNERYPSFRKVGSQRLSMQALKIDMTPMVDLGFLLISFFVITTQLSRPAAMALAMPKDGPPATWPSSKSLTVLLDKGNHIFYYSGDWEKAAAGATIFNTGYSGRNSLRNIIREKQRSLNGSELMLVIKAGPGATYKNLVDVLDEAVIGLVRRYAVVKTSEAENRWPGFQKK